MDLMQSFNEKYLKAEPPKVEVGSTVRVHIKVKEGNRERIQVFEGTVIAKKHGGVAETFTVRRVSYGVGVEKVFPLHSPIIEKIETVRAGKVRRAKLYYLRDQERQDQGEAVRRRIQKRSGKPLLFCICFKKCAATLFFALHLVYNELYAIVR